MGSPKIGYLDPKIEFSTKRYINTRILISGHDQTQALPPHPTVYMIIINNNKRHLPPFGMNVFLNAI